MLCRLMHNTLQSLETKLILDHLIYFKSKRDGEKRDEEVGWPTAGIRGMEARLKNKKGRQVAEMIIMRLYV